MPLPQAFRRFRGAAPVRPAGSPQDSTSTPPPTPASLPDLINEATRDPATLVQGGRRPSLVTFSAPWAAGATVSIDGGPFVLLPVTRRLFLPDVIAVAFRAPGRHDLVTSLLGFTGQAPEQAFEVEPDQMPVRAGLLIVEVANQGARVSVDGGVAYPAPYAGGALEGEHTVVVTAPGCQAETIPAAVADGRTRRITVTLAPAGMPAWAIAAIVVVVGVTLGAAAGLVTGPRPPLPPAPSQPYPVYPQQQPSPPPQLPARLATARTALTSRRRTA